MLRGSGVGPRKVTPRRSLPRGGKCDRPWVRPQVRARERRQGSLKITSDIPKRREGDDKNAVAVVEKRIKNGVVYHKIQMRSFLKVETPGETRMQKVLNAIQRVRFTEPTLRQASIREKKGPSLGKMNVQVFRQRSPLRCEI